MRIIGVHFRDVEKDYKMLFTLPELPYEIDALASLGMSEETLSFHHNIHHKAYVDNLNKLIVGTEWEAKTLEEIIVGTYQADAVAQNGIFNNASQHWNHCMFWEVMSPEENKKMPDRLQSMIESSFGSVGKFKEEFSAAGASQFGSGWAWLVLEKNGKTLKVTKTENGVNPLCFGQKALLCCDVWEHSYYIDFRNKRPGYLSNFLDKLVDWQSIDARI